MLVCDLFLILLLLVNYFVLLLLKRVDLLVLNFLLVLSKFVKSGGLLVNKTANTVRDDLLCVKLLLQKTDLFFQVRFYLIVESLLASQFTVSLSVSVLHIQLSFGLCLIDLFLQILDLRIILRGFLSVVVLSSLEILIKLFDFNVKLLFLVSQSLKFSLLIQARLDLLFELRIGEVSHLSH